MGSDWSRAKPDPHHALDPRLPLSWGSTVAPVYLAWGHQGHHSVLDLPPDIRLLQSEPEPTLSPPTREFGGTIGQSPQESLEPTIFPRSQGITKVPLGPLSACTRGGRRSVRSPTSLRSPHSPGSPRLHPFFISRPLPQLRAPPHHGGEGASRGRGAARRPGEEGASWGGAWRRRRRARTRRYGARAALAQDASGSGSGSGCGCCSGARAPVRSASWARRGSLTASPPCSRALPSPIPPRWEPRAEPRAAPACCLCSASCCCRCWAVSPGELGNPGSPEGRRGHRGGGLGRGRHRAWVRGSLGLRGEVLAAGRWRSPRALGRGPSRPAPARTRL